MKSRIIMMAGCIVLASALPVKAQDASKEPVSNSQQYGNTTVITTTPTTPQQAPATTVVVEKPMPRDAITGKPVPTAVMDEPVKEDEPSLRDKVRSKMEKD